MNQHHEKLDSKSSCESVEIRIHELMDLRQPLLSDELVRNHIRDCDHCAELIVDYGALNESLTQIPLETIHRLSGLQAPSQEPTRRRVHPVSFVASVACLLLVCLTSGIWFAPSQTDAIPTRIEMVSTPIPPNTLAGSEVDTEVDMSELSQQMIVAPAFHMMAPSTEFINTVSLERISGGVEPYQDYIDMTADLPGIQPVSKSVNATLHIIRSISERPASDRNIVPKRDDVQRGPDVGCHDSLAMQLCCV
jgi:hypothetical protein